MTRPLSTVLRMQDRRLQDLRRELAAASARLSTIESAQMRLHDEVLKPAIDPLFGSGAWQTRVAAERRRLSGLCRSASEAVSGLQDQLREASAEKLAFETVSGRILDSRLRRRAAREQSELDDLVAASRRCMSARS